MPQNLTLKPILRHLRNLVLQSLALNIKFLANLLDDFKEQPLVRKLNKQVLKLYKFKHISLLIKVWNIAFFYTSCMANFKTRNGVSANGMGNRGMEREKLESLKHGTRKARNLSDTQQEKPES